MQTRFALAIMLSLAALLYGQVSAQCALPWPPGSFSISSSALFPLALIALMLSFFVVGIGFIISQVVPGTKLGPWLKNEMWEIAKSAILIAIIFSLLILLGNVALILTGGQVYTPQSSGISATYAAINSIETNLGNSAALSLYIAYCGALPLSLSSPPVNSPYMSYSTAIGSIESLSSGIFSLAMGLGFLKSLVIGYYLPIPTFPGIPVPYFGSQFNIYKNAMLESSVTTGTYDSMLNDEITMLLLPVSLIVAIQYYLIPILLPLGIGVLIPLGIVLRAFPFLRGIGGTLVALGIGISIIYPTVLVFINEPVTVVTGTTFNPSSIVSTYVCEILGGNFITAAFTVLLPCSAQSGVAAALSSFGTIYPALNFLSNGAMILLVQFFLFIFDLMIVYPMIDNIAKSLGGTIRLELGGKLKIR